MLDVFSLLLILAVIGILGATFWIWKYKTNWTTVKKAAASLLIATGLVVAVFASFIAVFAGYLGGDDRGVWIEEVNKSLNKFDYTEITQAELEEHPVLKKAVSITEHRMGMNGTEWEQTQKFLDNKWHERDSMFVMDEKDLEEELNKSIVTNKMKEIFASEGYPIPENSDLRQDGDSWYIIRKYYLFSITDTEVEKELNIINTTSGNDSEVPAKLKIAFASSGFSLDDNARISGRDGKWLIDRGIGYTIVEEEGKLNIYTGDEKNFEIRRVNDKFNIVYIGPLGSPIFKIRDKYYRFEFWVS